MQSRRFELITLTVCALAVMVTACAALGAVTPPGTAIQTSADVEYKSAIGQSMPPVTSNIVSTSVNYPDGLTIGQAKNLADGEFVRLAETVVIAGTEDLGAAYASQEDRSSGIRVVGGQPLIEGQLAVIAGKLETSAGERQLRAHDAQTLAVNHPVPDPLHIIQRMVYSRGPDKVGMLISVMGRVTSVKTGLFYVDDGSELQDGSGEIGMRVYGTAPSGSLGKYVRVVGVLGTEVLNDKAIPIIRMRKTSDAAGL